MTTDDTDRLNRLVDNATDPGWADEIPALIECEASDLDTRAQATAERTADALAAIALLLLRRDEDAWSEWRRY